MWTLLKRVLVWGPPGLALLGLVAYLALPWPVRLRWSEPGTTSFMRYRVAEARARGEPLDLRHAWVPLEDVSSHMVRAVILAEDGRFREHKGVDWSALAEEVRYDGEPPFSWLDPGDLRALARAARYYLEHRDEVRGRSTITQQLAKNLYFTPKRSLARKVGEVAVAQRLEWLLSKDRILELYLNTIELGPGIFGVESAAREYFGTTAGRLTPYQAASLAGTLPHPLTSNPGHQPGRMAWRRDVILGRMGGRSADRTPVPVAPEPREPPSPPEPDLGREPPEPVVPAVDPDRPPVAPPPVAPPPADTARPPGGPGPAAPPDTTRPRADTSTASPERPSPESPERQG